MAGDFFRATTLRSSTDCEQRHLASRFDSELLIGAEYRNSRANLNFENGATKLVHNQIRTELLKLGHETLRVPFRLEMFGILFRSWNFSGSVHSRETHSHHKLALRFRREY